MSICGQIARPRAFVYRLDILEATLPSHYLLAHVCLSRAVIYPRTLAEEVRCHSLGKERSKPEELRGLENDHNFQRRRPGNSDQRFQLRTREPAGFDRRLDSSDRRDAGKAPGIVSAALHRSKDGTRVVNYAQWKSAEAWDNLVELGKTNYFTEMGKFAKPDAHLYEVCYVLDKTSQSP